MYFSSTVDSLSQFQKLYIYIWVDVKNLSCTRVHVFCSMNPHYIYILTLVTFGSLVLSSFSSENRSLFAWHWTQPPLLDKEWMYDLEMNHTRVSGHSSELNMCLKLGYSMYLMIFSVIRSFLLSQSHKV